MASSSSERGDTGCVIYHNRQVMSATHPCFMPLCDRTADMKWAICATCFRTLPEDLRFAINRAFSPSMTPDNASPGLRIAINNAHAWVVATFGGVAREKYDPGKWERLVQYVRDRDAARRARREAAGPPPPPPRHLRLVP